MRHSPGGRSGSWYALNGVVTYWSNWARNSAIVGKCCSPPLPAAGAGGIRAASSGSKAGIVNRDVYVASTGFECCIYPSCVLQSSVAGMTRRDLRIVDVGS